MALAWEKRLLWTAAALSLPPILAAFLLQAPAAPAHTADSARPEVDTFIPKGFVLVPIEVQNYESLDSILGHFGIVDLFQSANPAHPGQRLVARNVRLLRAPQNPSHFAILVPEAEVPQVLQYGGPFTVIIKRPDKGGTEIVKDLPESKRKIVYEGGS